MYTADHADIDPRNPANWPERAITRYYIDPNQFSDAEMDVLDTMVTDVDVVLDEEALAKVAAKNIAEIIGRPVVISCGDDEDFFTEIKGA